ncbi:MAG TPA: cupredoxin family copper-binding protein [Longimicrobiales bacterium]
MRRAWLLFLCAMLPSSLSAQSLLERTPNVSGGWVGVPGTVYFNFLHRFTNSGAPERQVTNYPTFLLGYAPLRNALLGVNYSTRSDIAPRFPNEYEIFARYAALPFASLQAGYNQAAESFDAELGLTRAFGPVRVLAAGRVLTNGFASDTTRFAIAGGATLHFARWFALAGDVASLLDARDNEEVAWSAALQIAIPYTPHTFSLQAANTNTATLQGQSRGLDDVRYGFEFTIPITLSRWFSRAETTEETESAENGGVHVGMKALQFTPSTVRVRAGQAVTWQNNDQLAHTVTAADGSWTSPLIQPGKSYRRVFQAPGTYQIVCTPHPFMKAVVEVVP